MESELGYYEAKALLEWQIELGADEAIEEAPINRFEIPQKLTPPASLAKKQISTVPAIPAQKSADLLHQEAVSAAKMRAQNANSIDELAEIMQAFEGCDLKKGARGFCFADGNPKARIMVVGEVPSVEEDRNSTSFYGVQKQLLDKMFAAIGHSRNDPNSQMGLYLTNVLPWPTPQNREPQLAELDLMRPFLERHIELADPDILVLMGNSACQSLIGKGNVNRLRGQWNDVLSRPSLAMLHPAKLLRSPALKREAWADLLALQARLKDMNTNG